MTNKQYVALAGAVALGAVIGFVASTAGAAVTVREALADRDVANVNLATLMADSAETVQRIAGELAEAKAELASRKPKTVAP